MKQKLPCIFAMPLVRMRLYGTSKIKREPLR